MTSDLDNLEDPWATVTLAPGENESEDQGGKPLVEVSATTRRDGWTASEIQKLCDLFRSDWAIADIAEAIGRPLHGTRSKVDQLGLRRNSRRPWTDEEDRELLSRYGLETAAAIAGDLGRTPSQVYARAAVLGATDFAPDRWSAWEVETLKSCLCEAWTMAGVAKVVGRPLSGVIDKAHRLGLASSLRRERWTAAEDEALLRMALEQDLTAREIANELSSTFSKQRTRQAVKIRLQAMGIDRQDKAYWTAEEDEVLRNMYARGCTASEIARTLTRGHGAVRWRARYLRLQHPNARGDAWREDERAYLQENYGRKDAQTLAEELGRPKKSIQAEASRLGLRQRKRWTPQEDARLLNHTGSFKDLAAELNVNYQSMMKRRQTLLERQAVSAEG